jgi:hypothetical protein
VKVRVALPVLALAASPLTLASPASAAGWDVPEPYATGLAGPLQVSLTDPASGPSAGEDQRPEALVVAQQFGGAVSRVRWDGHVRDLVTDAPGVGGVAMKDGRVAFTVTGKHTAQLRVRGRGGTVRTVAHLARYEKRVNPDRSQTYGFLDLAADCADQVTGDLPVGPYQGGVDSHPYALANAPHGGWYVADAGGNDILEVSPRGTISTVFVAPRQRTVITAEAADTLGLPDCTVGATYAFEPVPTDVEVNRHGKLFVTLLPGGPQSSALGGRGKLLKVRPRSHESVRIASGFAGAVNLALGAKGRVYVAELFADKVSFVRVNHNVGVVEDDWIDAPAPAALEYRGDYLYLGYDVQNSQGGSLSAYFRPGAIGR